MGGEGVHVSQMVLGVAIVSQMVLGVAISHFEVLKCRGLHLVVTEVVSVAGGADNKEKFLCCSVFEWGTKKGLEFTVTLFELLQY